VSDKKKKIALTGRAPVLIVEDDWPVIASASENDRHGAQIGNDPNQETDWVIEVREHQDGRMLVLALYDYSTLYQDEKSVSLRGGELLDSFTHTSAGIVAAIQRVGAAIEARILSRGDESGVFPRLVEECIADLPAEELV
jgi:hypothetical protein